MVNYLAKFTPNLTETTAPMRSLLKKDLEFVWDCAQQTAFDKMKLLITSEGTLAYHDVKKEVTLEVDAQIEKEMYAIVFGTERFHQYIYGRNVAVNTDHKPLEAILSNLQFQLDCKE